jgi:hypothetical protein
MTLQNAPPGLDYERDRRFSKVVPILSVGYQLLTIYVVSYSRLCSSVYLSKEAFSVLTSHLKRWLQCAWSKIKQRDQQLRSC